MVSGNLSILQQQISNITKLSKLFFVSRCQCDNTKQRVKPTQTHQAMNKFQSFAFYQRYNIVHEHMIKSIEILSLAMSWLKRITNALSIRTNTYARLQKIS